MIMTLKVSPEEMAQAINQFESTRGEAEAAVTSINNIIAELSSAWSGDSSDAFTRKMETINTAMVAMQSRLEGYVTGLNDALQQYQNTESDTASKIAALEDAIIS